MELCKLSLERSNSRLLINGKAVCIPVSVYFKDCGFEETHSFQEYKELRKLGPMYIGKLDISVQGVSVKILDVWEPAGEKSIRIRRVISGEREGEGFAVGINVGLQVPIEEKAWSFFVPAACYKESPIEDGGKAFFEEGRLPYPLVLAYDEVSGIGISLLRVSLAKKSEVPCRGVGDISFIQKTDIGSIGYSNAPWSGSYLCAFLPYYEGPRSVALNKNLAPVKAFYPLRNGVSLEAEYELRSLESHSYEEACFQVYSYACSLSRPEPVELPFSLEHALMLRLGSLAYLVRNWNEHAGLVLNFNPREGIDSPPKGFGTSFNRLVSERYTSVLEYGFTGRQLNNAYVLMFFGKRLGQGNLADLGRKIADTFVNRCVHKSGYLYTLYDFLSNKPFDPIGDPQGGWLHYGVGGSSISGNYLRNMVEAAYDLCLCYEALSNNAWLKVASDFGHFLIEVQNQDGSWYRAYSPSGEAIEAPEEWFGDTLDKKKSVTPIPVPFLLRLYGITGQKEFLLSAQKACDWTLENVVAESHYRGGTLDNPNIIDKEAMAYAMKALLDCYEQTFRLDYLEGAISAGKLSLTWNFLWNVPFEEGTRLKRYDFKTRGWGGINIIWAGGVVDIYSLFFIDEWIRLGELLRDKTFLEVVELIKSGTQQLLSYPGEYYDMVSFGMQEEGFACSNQGIDEGMIEKGSTWGSLGWIYAAGTYGLLRGVIQSENLDR